MRVFVKLQVAGLFILLIYSITNIIYPYFLKLIIDDAIAHKSLNKLLSYSAIMILVIILSILLRYVKTIYFFDLGEKISLHIKNCIVAHIFRYNLNFFKKHNMEEIISILEQDVSGIQTIFNDFFTNVLMFIGLTFVLAFFNFKIALLSISISGIYLFFQRSFEKLRKKEAYQISLKKGQFQAFIQELIRNISNIQLHNQIEYFKNNYNNNLKEFYEMQFNGTSVRAKSYILYGVFEGANLMTVFCYGGYLVLTGDLTIGSLFALMFYVQKLFSPIVGLVNDCIEIKKIQACIDRTYQILESDQDKIPLGKMRCIDDYTIHFLNLSFSYNQNNRFSNINLEIKQGDKIAVTGENGSGKETLINLLLKIQDYKHGNIYIGDKNIKNIDHSYYDKILLVKKEPFIFSGSILENLVMGVKDISIEKIHEALFLVDLLSDIKSMKQGLNTLIGEQGVKLSSQQAQKLALARIFLLNDYSILILEEPGGVLDFESEQMILNNIFNLKKDSTILVITYRKEVLKYCNKILEISNKKIDIKDNNL